MSVRVITSRRVLPGKERLVFKGLNNLRKLAIDAPGFMGSSVFRDNDNRDCIVVVSEWHSKKDCQRWMKQAERQEVLRASIDQYLYGPTTNQVLEPVHDADVFLL